MKLFMCSSLQKAKSLSEEANLFPLATARCQAAEHPERRNLHLISHSPDAQMNQSFPKTQINVLSPGEEGEVSIGEVRKVQDKIW